MLGIKYASAWLAHEISCRRPRQLSVSHGWGELDENWPVPQAALVSCISREKFELVLLRMIVFWYISPLRK